MVHRPRVAMQLARRLEAAATDRDRPVPALVVRAGDSYGPQVRSSWFAQAMVTQGRPVTRLKHLSPGIGHGWAYLPDLAQAMVRLMAHPDLRAFERVGFEGFWDASGREFPALVAAAAGQRTLRDTAFPWWLLKLAAPFGGFPREAIDVRPYWRHAVRIDHTRLRELLGHEPRTEPVQAMRATLQGLGCLPDATDPGDRVRARSARA